MLKKLLKAILKYPIIIGNRLFSWLYFKYKKPNREYVEINPRGDEKILVLSPHVDDETIGLGACLLKYARRNSKMSLVYLTDGRGSTSYKTEEETIKERMEEGLEIKESYGFDSIYFLEEIDGSLDSQKEVLVDRLVDIIKKEEPDIIFSPFLIDGNTDHIETTKTLSNALTYIDRQIKIYLYQVNSIISPDLVNGLSFMDKDLYLDKKEKYKIFKSQWAMGFGIYNLLDRARAWNYDNNKYAAEAFVIIDKASLREVIREFEINKFDPYRYIQISSEFTLIRSMIKSAKEKSFYRDIVKNIMLENTRQGASSKGAI